MLGADPAIPGEPSCAEIVDALRPHGAEPASDIEDLWRWIAFLMRITNIDDHLINHGFVPARGDALRLSPAFDINLFPDRAGALKVWIFEAVGAEATIEALMSVYPYLTTTSKRARRILAEIECVVGG